MCMTKLNKYFHALNLWERLAQGLLFGNNFVYLANKRKWQINQYTEEVITPSSKAEHLDNKHQHKFSIQLVRRLYAEQVVQSNKNGLLKL